VREHATGTKNNREDGQWGRDSGGAALQKRPFGRRSMGECRHRVCIASVALGPPRVFLFANLKKAAVSTLDKHSSFRFACTGARGGPSIPARAGASRRHGWRGVPQLHRGLVERFALGSPSYGFELRGLKEQATRRRNNQQRGSHCGAVSPQLPCQRSMCPIKYTMLVADIDELADFM